MKTVNSHRSWRRAGLALSLGVLAVAGLAPLGLWPLMLVALGGLYLLIRVETHAARAALTGWCFGLGYFLAGLHWLGNAFMVDADRLAWAAVPAVVALSALMALYAALATALTVLVAAPGLARAFALPALWTFSELLRATLFGGFPWNLVGYALAGNDALAQVAALGGIHALGFITVLCATLGATALTMRGRWRWVFAVAGIGAIGLTWGHGALRLAAAATGETATMLRLVQADIPQSLKWRPDQREAIIARYLKLSAQPPAGPAPTIVLWPESALPVALDQAGAFAPRLQAVVPPGGYLVTGAVRYHPDATGGGPHPHNSAVAIDDAGRIAADYDKVRLVPFGEFVPLARHLPIEKMTIGAEDFRPGPGPRGWAIAGLPPVQPLICYEAIFPGDLPPTAAQNRPTWLLNLTNDGWFGRSAGLYQHLAMARMRAVERGLPLVRVANGGVSVVTDGYGRIVASLPIDTVGVLDANLPRPLAARPLYDRYGDRPIWILVIVVIATISTSQAILADRTWKGDGA